MEGGKDTDLIQSFTKKQTYFKTGLILEPHVDLSHLWDGTLTNEDKSGFLDIKSEKVIFIFLQTSLTCWSQITKVKKQKCFPQKFQLN